MTISPDHHSLSRRKVLTWLAAAPLAVAPLAAPTTAIGQELPADRRGHHHRRRDVEELETRFGARVSLYARNLSTGHTFAYRAEERSPMCSLFKPVAVAAVLAFRDRNGELLDRRIRYQTEDVVENSPVTSTRVEQGMTVWELCDAALRFSDNTAGNLLLHQIGGPAGLTRAARRFGDDRTRLDRWEPDLNEARPGDDRDTTTARAIGMTYARLLLGRLLSRPDRTLLRNWMLDNQTSGTRFRAGLPAGWSLADKTGAGHYGTLNDVGVAFSPAGVPVLISVLSRKDQPKATADNQLMAEAAALALDVLDHARHHR